jgi:hypothetical protein
MMANLLKDTFGKMLAMVNLKNGLLPSPASLKHRVIIKGTSGNKKISVHSSSCIETINSQNPNCSHLDFDLDTPTNEENLTDVEFSEDANTDERVLNMETIEQVTDHIVVEKVKIADELLDITSLGGVKFKGWDDAKERPANQMSSFSEKKAEKLLKTSPEEWVLYNQEKLSRIYPANLRVDSSNYDPTSHWCIGSQIVALNFQTKGLPMYLNHGRFRDNGGTGYVLKPNCLLTKPLNLNEPARIKLTIWIWSAQQLPKVRKMRKKMYHFFTFGVNFKLESCLFYETCSKL